MKTLIIDNAIHRPSHICFNRLQRSLGRVCYFYDYPRLRGRGLEELDYLSIIVLGSFSNVTDNEPWHSELSEFLIQQLERKVPVLGICFGHQLMAHRWGARVGPRKGGLAVGVRKIELLESGEKVGLLVQHSQEVKSLPQNCRHLASSDQCKFEAIQHLQLPYIGIQAHPEASDDFVIHTMKLSIDSEILRAQEDGLMIIKKYLSQIESA